MIPIITINGINRSGPATVERMGIQLQAAGREVHRLTYPTRTWTGTRNRRNQYLDAVRMINQLPTQPVDVVAHSWGCMLACRMMELGGSDIFRNVIFFAPAIDRDWVFPLKAFRRLYVIHNEQDRAVWAARMFFTGWHPWGDMGRVGYAGTDPRVVNVKDDTERTAWEELMHGHYFANGHLKRWTEYVMERTA